MSKDLPTIEFKTADQLVDEWKAKHFPPVPRDEKWHQFKWRICKAGDPLNQILRASGGEIEVEQFGIVGWLNKMPMRKDCNVTINGKKPRHYIQCSLVEARETGTGKFGEWLESVKAFCATKHHAPFALATITNQGLYKHLQRHGVFVAVGGMLYTVKRQESQ